MEMSQSMMNLCTNPDLLQEALCHAMRFALYAALDKPDAPRVLMATEMVSDFADEHGLSKEEIVTLLDLDCQSIGVLAKLSPTFPVREVGLMVALDDQGFFEVKPRVCSVLAAAYRGALYRVVDGDGQTSQETIDAAVLLDNVMRTESLTMRDVKNLTDLDLKALQACSGDVA